MDSTVLYSIYPGSIGKLSSYYVRVWVRVVRVGKGGPSSQLDKVVGRSIVPCKTGPSSQLDKVVNTAIQ